MPTSPSSRPVQRQGMCGHLFGSADLHHRHVGLHQGPGDGQDGGEKGERLKFEVSKTPCEIRDVKCR